MSDPVTNAEVEDVLSSIRRLVSEDKRPMQSQSAEPAPEQNDRLVLTPSLRVADDPEPTAAEPEVVNEEPLELNEFMDVSEEVTFEEDDHHDDPDDQETGESAAELAEDYSTDPYDFDADEGGEPDEVYRNDDTQDDDGAVDDALEEPEALTTETEVDGEAEPEETAKLELPPEIFAYRDNIAEAAAKDEDRKIRRVHGHIEAENNYGKWHKGLCGRSAYGAGSYQWITRSGAGNRAGQPAQHRVFGRLNAVPL